MTTGGTPGTVSHSRLNDMIVSVTRHKNSPEDNAFTCQFRLTSISTTNLMSCTVDAESVGKLRSMLEDRLCVSLTDMSIVWRLFETRQVAVITDLESLATAIVDHSSAGKYTIQLYVVKNSSKVEPTTKARSQTSNMCLDITNIPSIFSR